jgi:serine/threonine protein kinase
MSGEVARWNRVKRVFQEALDRPTEDRRRFLDEACGDDRSLHAEVESLLRNLREAGEFGERPPIDALPAPVEPGGRIGQYVILERIGRGGMGDVYRALDTALKRHVAIKVVSEQFASDPVRLARFEREAMLIAALNDPHIAAIYSLERTQSGRHALILEFVEGATLAERLRDGPLPVETALHVARQIAEALEAAHGQAIVHRDLKPANIKLRPDGVVKVLDFGLAKSLVPDERPAFDTELIASRAVMGTPAYMSPEQACGLPVDERVDIWAFGCVLYEMLTRTRAFEGESVAATLTNVIGREPAWDRLPPGLPPALVTLVKRCLRKDVTERPSAIVEVRTVLSESVNARPAADQPEAMPVTSSLAPVTVILRRWAIAVSSTLVLALLIWYANRALTHEAATPEETRLFVIVAGLIVFVTMALRRRVARKTRGIRQ